MAASTVTALSHKSQAALIEYYKASQELQTQQRSSLRARMLKIDKAYQREQDLSEANQRAKAANEAGDPHRLQNVTVPIVAPQVEAATTYQTSVFLTGYPLFGVVSAPDYIDEAVQMETVIDEQSIKGGWTRDFMLFFRDGFKYNFAPMEVSWKQITTATIETDITVNAKQGVAKKVIWSGNDCKHLDAYNMVVDPRVPPAEAYRDAEFMGYTENFSRIKLKTFVEGLPDKIVANLPAIYKSGLGSSTSVGSEDAYGFYVPDINPEVTKELERGSGTNWMKWAGMSDIRTGLEYKDVYDVTTFYCRIIPSEFGMRIPSRNIPQIFKLIIVNHEHILYCERQTNAHNIIPILIGQPLEDGLGYQTKSLAKNAIPFQYTATSYMASIIASRRRAISDRTLYDPSRVAATHINSENPSAKIPVRPAAYGKKVADAVHQFPYREDQAANSMQQIQTLITLANDLAGQNKVTQGQFVKGNKTRDEFQETMQNANGRDQMASILYEAQVFVPLKEILKLNILQFQGGTTVYNRDKQVAVEIDPVKLRKAVLEFKVSDGLIPSSKLINGDDLNMALQVIGSSPQISAGYNIAPMFSYLMKTRGAKISEFEKSAEQQAYEQALGAWQAMTQLAIEKGVDFDKEQPLPEQFGYDPSGKGDEPANELTDEQAPQ